MTHHPPRAEPLLAPAEVLSAAADLLKRQGWHQGGPFDRSAVTPERPPSACPLCVLGAIAVVCGLPPDIWTEWPLTDIGQRARVHLAVQAAEALAVHLGVETVPVANLGDIADLIDAAEHYDVVIGSRWNDHAAEFDELLTALREAGKAATR